jgi:hypothetical protein
VRQRVVHHDHHQLSGMDREIAAISFRFWRFRMRLRARSQPGTRNILAKMIPA